MQLRERQKVDKEILTIKLPKEFLNKEVEIVISTDEKKDSFFSEIDEYKSKDAKTFSGNKNYEELTNDIS